MLLTVTTFIFYVTLLLMKMVTIVETKLAIVLFEKQSCNYLYNSVLFCMTGLFSEKKGV